MRDVEDVNVNLRGSYLKTFDLFLFPENPI